MQYDGQWLRDRRHGSGTLTIESAGKVHKGVQRCCSRTSAQAPYMNETFFIEHANAAE